MSANTAYPNADGRICDWIEIHNTSDKPFNVSGYRLSDDVTQAKYAFPVTVAWGGAGAPPGRVHRLLPDPRDPRGAPPPPRRRGRAGDPSVW